MIVSDIDGTIADSSHRSHLFKEHHSKWDWEAIQEGIKYDTIREEVLALLSHFSKEHRIVFLTSRNESQRKETEKWLDRLNLPYKLMMRKSKEDWTPDLEHKLPIVKKLDPEWIVEDRPHLVKAFRKEGFKVIDVGVGDDIRLSYERS